MSNNIVYGVFNATALLFLVLNGGIRNPQSHFDFPPHTVDRNVHTRGVAATAAVTINAAIEIEAFDDDVILRERPGAARFGRTEDRYNRRSSRRGDVHRPRVSTDKQIRVAGQREELFESGAERDRRVRA